MNAWRYYSHLHDISLLFMSANFSPAIQRIHSVTSDFAALSCHFLLLYPLLFQHMSVLLRSIIIIFASIISRSLIRMHLPRRIYGSGSINGAWRRNCRLCSFLYTEVPGSGVGFGV